MTTWAPVDPTRLLAIQVGGTSLQEETGIAPGDVVVVDRQCRPMAGDLLCVTLLDDGPARLSRYGQLPTHRPPMVGEVLTVDGELAAYEGVVIKHIRDLPRATAPRRERASP